MYVTQENGYDTLWLLKIKFPNKFKITKILWMNLNIDYKLYKNDAIKLKFNEISHK